MADTDQTVLDDKGIEIPDSQQQHDEWIPSAAEERALAGGWRPKEEWVENGGDPDDWVDAREFNVRGELMGRITQQGRKLGSLEQQLSQAYERIAATDRVTQKLIKDAVDRTKRALQQEKREAIRNDDYETADRIDNELDELRDATTAADQAPGTPAPQQNQQFDPIAATWAMYVSNTPEVHDERIFRPLIQYAEQVRQEAGTNVGNFMKKVQAKADELRGVSQRPRPRGGPDDDKGGNRNKRPAGKGDKFTKADLNEQQRFIGDGYVQEGLYASLDEYAQELGKGGGLDRQR